MSDINNIFDKSSDSNETLEENGSKVIINNTTSQIIKYYKPDKEVVKGRSRCDWLLINDIKEWYIELKGSILNNEAYKKACEQIINTYEDFHNSNIEENEFYIVCIRMKSPKLYQKSNKKLYSRYPNFIKKINIRKSTFSINV